MRTFRRIVYVTLIETLIAGTAVWFAVLGLLTDMRPAKERLRNVKSIWRQLAASTDREETERLYQELREA